MQRDAAYLADILAAAADLSEFARAASWEDFCSNKTVRYAVPSAWAGGTPARMPAPRVAKR